MASEKPERAVDIQGVHAHYGEVHVLQGVDAHVNRGEIVAVLGGNGAGKTTLLKSMCGLLTPSAGKIFLHGEEIQGLPPHRIGAKGIGLSSQGRQVFPRMTVHENLVMGAYFRRDAAAVREDFERVHELFPVLADRRKQQAGNLSGGEQQMLAIARALMGRPSVLLLDEPSMGVAPKIVQQVQEVVLRIVHEGTTVVLVEQNVPVALEIATRAYVLELGVVGLAGSSEDIADSDRIADVYLGGGAH